MDQPWAENLLQDARAVWIVGAVVALLFLITDLPWQLDDYDQAKQAFTSFEMIKEGHWLFQRTPHERIATKPPLVGWISAGVFEITRSWDAAWRLPSLVAAAGLAIVLFRAAKSAYGLSAGLIGLSAFGLNLLSPRLATLVRTDMPLTLVIFLAGLLIWQKTRSGESWSARDRLLMFMLLTAGMLIKGPIVYGFLLPGIALFACLRRKTVSPWCGWWPWVASLLIFLAWVIAGTRLVPGFYDQVVVREFVARFGETIHRPQPIYFYLPHLLHKFAPWSILMILFAIFGARSENAGLRGMWAKIAPDTLWLLCWSLGGLIVMSFIPSKRVDRIFPIVPPLCLLLSAQFGKLLTNEQLRRCVYRWAVAALALSILFTGGYTVFKVTSGYRDQRDALVRFGHAVRAEAAAHGWRYEAVNVSDEGLLLYLERLHFIEPQPAVAAWNLGNLDALVVPARDTASYLGSLRNASLSPLQSTEERGEFGKGYVLLTR